MFPLFDAKTFAFKSSNFDVFGLFSIFKVEDFFLKEEKIRMKSNFVP